MPFKLNVFTGTLDLVTANTGFVRGPATTTDKAVARWSGTDGSQIQDSLTVVQDGGAIEAQAFITRTVVTGDVTVHSGQAWVAPSIELSLTGSILLESDSELIVV